MCSPFGGVGFQVPVHAETFAGRAEQGQKDDGEGIDQQRPIASFRIGDAQLGHSHAESQIRGIPETGFDGPSFGVLVRDLPRRCIGIACRQTPPFLHVLGMNANDGTAPVACGRQVRGPS